MFSETSASLWRNEMEPEQPTGTTSRRKFLQYSAMLSVGWQTLMSSRDARAAVYAAKEAAGVGSLWPEMTYRTLGRTGFRASRLVMGCGASLAIRSKDELLNAAYDAGINVFDVGYSGYYFYAQENLASFINRVRDDVFLISKAPAGLDPDVAPNQSVTVEQAKHAAKVWSEQLDESLGQLQVDYVDAYYLMASYNPSLIKSEEIYNAFQRAKQAGKVKHLGLSTHRNAEKVVLAAAETGWYDLAMIAITPGGWYDWETKSVLKGSKPMTGLLPVLEKVRNSGMGLVGMKAARHIAGRIYLPWGNPDTFNEYYDEKLMSAQLSPFQRSYAYVLAHGLDVVNADIGNFGHLEENVHAATSSQEYFA
jgi:predicted aldo/keto reductase-like oxidoreductase